MILNTISDMDENAPVRQHYNIFLNEVQVGDEQEIDNELANTNILLSTHRTQFCAELDDNIDNGIFDEENTDQVNSDIESIKGSPILNRINYNQLCPTDEEITISSSNLYLSNNWNTLCSSDVFDISANVIFNKRIINSDNTNIYQLCKYENGGRINDENHRYLCPNSVGTGFDTNKTFCST